MSGPDRLSRGVPWRRAGHRDRCRGLDRGSPTASLDGPGVSVCGRARGDAWLRAGVRRRRQSAVAHRRPDGGSHALGLPSRLPVA